MDDDTVHRSADIRHTRRHAKIAERESLSAAEHDRLSQALEAHLETLLRRCQPRILGFCWPFRAEFDCRPLMTRLLNETKQLRTCLPRVVSANAPLTFRDWRPESAMSADRYGILYPTHGDELTPDVLLVPVNAFDAQGYRLGYGSGYFDRTLAAMVPPPLAIGIGFELARIASIEPESHDIPLDAVVTEAGIDIFSSRMPAPCTDK